MKHIQCISIAFIAFAISACQFSKGVKTDLKTGLSVSYNGFALENIYLADADGNRLQDNTIVLGQKLVIRAVGVENYIEKNGNVFPGCTIVLTDKNNTEILNLADAFSHLTEGMPSNEASTLDASITTGSPMVIGEIYHLSIHFYDKQKNENGIFADIDLIIK